MATIREYFDRDNTAPISVHKDWRLSVGPDTEVGIIAKIHHNFDARAKYWSFYIPSTPAFMSICQWLIEQPHVAACTLDRDGDPVSGMMGMLDDPEVTKTSDLMFTGRVFLYFDGTITEEERERIRSHAASLNLLVAVRDSRYAETRSSAEKPLAFISHDSRDKDELARPLALELASKQLCPVWYDEHSLNVGDSLRAAIEEGLKSAKKCIVILSPHFLSNDGWTKAEFDSVFTREMLEKQNVILPIWHNVGSRDVYEYSPRLADKVGLQSSLGIPELAAKLAAAIRR